MELHKRRTRDKHRRAVKRQKLRKQQSRVSRLMYKNKLQDLENMKLILLKALALNNYRDALRGQFAK